LLAETISTICCSLFDEKNECYGESWESFSWKLSEKKYWADPHLHNLRLKNVHPEK
jgi:hypothetical protein